MFSGLWYNEERFCVVHDFRTPGLNTFNSDNYTIMGLKKVGAFLYSGGKKSILLIGVSSLWIVILFNFCLSSSQIIRRLSTLLLHNCFRGKHIKNCYFSNFGFMQILVFINTFSFLFRTVFTFIFIFMLHYFMTLELYSWWGL